MSDATRLQPAVHWPAQVHRIPKEVFVREDIYEEELRRIFHGAEWHVIAHAGEVPRVGDFKTFTVGRVPLLLTRAADDELRVFYNACTHRSTQLETAVSGNKLKFECPYHRWAFDAAGRLMGCPNEAEFSPGFDRADYPLARPRMAMFKGLVFVTLSEATPPLDEFLEEVGPTLADLMGGDGRLRLLGYQKVRYTSNWKSYNDNDGYHAPLLHKAFRLLGWQGGKGMQRASRVRGHNVFESQLTVPSDTGALADPSIIAFRGEDPSKGSRVVQLFPTFVATKHLDVINLRYAMPRSLDETEVHYAYFAHADDDEAMVTHRLRQSSNLLGPCGLVSMEDASVFHRVHIGNHTPGDAVFQKGVHSTTEISYDLKQNDETGNLPRWDYYRRIMGFARDAS